MLIQEGMGMQEKLALLADAAKYDVACTSSGVERKNKPGTLGNAVSAGLCHSFAADGRCISLLKILFTNQCIYDCRYCVNRRSNDTKRTAFTPDEVCRLTIEFYRRNYIEALGFFTVRIIPWTCYTRLCGNCGMNIGLMVIFILRLSRERTRLWWKVWGFWRTV